MVLGIGVRDNMAACIEGSTRGKRGTRGIVIAIIAWILKPASTQNLVKHGVHECQESCVATAVEEQIDGGPLIIHKNP